MPTLAERNRLLTVKEVAVRLALHPETVYRKIEAGAILAVRLGGPGSAIRIDEAELDKWLHEGRA
jgi:excisionase family DNA binding protein